MSMTLSEELEWRGFINQTTLLDIKELDEHEWTFYHGFDASADSQTVGNLAAMMLDKVFLRHGHKAILLAGGATSLIGDPGGKDKERVLQNETVIAQNVTKAEEQLKIVFDGFEFDMVNNLDWFKTMNVMQFLRDVGKHFSMTPLIQRDYIANRIGEGGAGISYTEFSYTLLQGYDYLKLFEDKGVNLQLSGSDQWGNCISGIDLVRKVHNREVHALTCPLVINKATGKKFGKSEEGAVWLDPNKTSPFKFYQFWLNVDDEGVEDYLKVYTELDKNTVDEILYKFHKDRAGRLAQKTLAYEVTKLLHGKTVAQAQVKIAEDLFGTDVITLSDKELSLLENDFQAAYVTERISSNDLIEALISTNLASSKTEARRFLQSGAIYINNLQLKSDTEFVFDMTSDTAVMRRGRNSIALLKRK